MDDHTGIIAVSGAGGEGQDMVAALWMNPGLDQNQSQQELRKVTVFLFHRMVFSSLFFLTSL